jgi:hypothetical protein
MVIKSLLLPTSPGIRRRRMLPPSAKGTPSEEGGLCKLFYVEIIDTFNIYIDKSNIFRRIFILVFPKAKRIIWYSDTTFPAPPACF